MRELVYPLYSELECGACSWVLGGTLLSYPTFLKGDWGYIPAPSYPTRGMKVVTKCVELLAEKHGVKVALHMVKVALLSLPGLLGALQEPNPSKQGVTSGRPWGSFSGAIAEVQESLGFAFAHREEQT